jgi:hypothetical protein
MYACKFISALLDCGWLDADYLMRLVDANAFDPRVLMEDICKITSDPTIDDLIYAAFERVARQFLDGLPSKVRLNADTLEYHIFTNCMDSHLWFDDERINALYEDWRRF